MQRVKKSALGWDRGKGEIPPGAKVGGGPGDLSEEGRAGPAGRRQLALALPAPRAPWEPVAPELGQALEEGPADRNPVLVYLASLAPESRRHMLSSLAIVARLLAGREVPPDRFPWPAIRHQHAQAVRSALAERYAPTSANRHLAALRGVLRTCSMLELMDAGAYQRAIAVRPVAGERLPASREVSRGELRALFEHRQVGPAGARDAALVALLYGCGLRGAEACALQLEDYDASAGELRVQGKGRKQRLIYPGAGARAALAAWLDRRGPAPGPLLLAVRKGGAIQPRGLTPQAVFYRVRRLTELARTASCSPHDLRRSFVTHLLDHGADVVAVRDLAGHANVQTTARYDRRGERGKRAAAELLEVPFSQAPVKG